MYVLSPIYESYLKDILGNQILTLGMIVRFCATLLHCYILSLLHSYIAALVLVERREINVLHKRIPAPHTQYITVQYVHFQDVGGVGVV